MNRYCCHCLLPLVLTLSFYNYQTSVFAAVIPEENKVKDQQSGLQTNDRLVTRSPVAVPTDLWSVDDWKKRFDAATESELRIAKRHSTSGDGWQLYNLAYYVDAFNSMFRATQEQQYMDRSLELIQDAISTAKPGHQFGSQYKDGYYSWGNQSHPSENVQKNFEYPLFESYLWRYVTVTLRELKNSDLIQYPYYQKQYDEILDFTLEHIVEKWFSRGVNSHIYRSTMNMASHWAYISMNLAPLVKDQALRAQLIEITARIDFKGMLGRFSGASLRKQLSPHPLNRNAYHFDSVWNGKGSHDVAHGNNLAAYLADAYEYGNYWNRHDMRMFAELVDSVILRTYDTKVEFVDGSGQGNGWVNDGFNKFGRYSVNVQRKLQQKSNSGIQYSGAGALNRYLLEFPKVP